MKAIDEKTLQRELFCKIQENAIDKGDCHVGGYKGWNILGSEVEKAISDIFSETGPFSCVFNTETLPIVQELRQQLLDAEAELEIYKIRCQDRKHYDYDLSNIGKAVF